MFHVIWVYFAGERDESSAVFLKIIAHGNKLKLYEIKVNNKTEKSKGNSWKRGSSLEELACCTDWTSWR